MVTVSFCLVLAFLAFLTAAIDTLLFKQSLLDSFTGLMDGLLQMPRVIVSVACLIGLLSSFVIDYRLKKAAKGERKSNEGAV